MLADMAIGIETARLAVQRSAWEVDQVSGFAGPLTKRCVLTRRRLCCVFVSDWFPWSTTAELEGISY